MNFSIANRDPLTRIERALAAFTKTIDALTEASSDLLAENAEIQATVVRLEATRESNLEAAARATTAAGQLRTIIGA